MAERITKPTSCPQCGSTNLSLCEQWIKYSTTTREIVDGGRVDAYFDEDDTEEVRDLDTPPYLVCGDCICHIERSVAGDSAEVQR